MNDEYLRLHLEWREQINPTEDIQIDESVFEEIYKLQEEQDDKERICKDQDKTR